MAIVLGLLTAIGPFAIDMYLPALPTIEENLATDTATAQFSLLAFFIAMALSQVVYGPLADMYGRKGPIYLGLALYGLGSIGCALAPSVEWLIAARVLQGLGAASGMVISRAVVRDLHTGPDAAQLMGLLMLVFSVSPILAPLAGSLILLAGDWRTIFWVMTAAAVAGAVLLAFGLKETRPREIRTEGSLGAALKGYRYLMGQPKYLGIVFIGAFAMSSFMVYLANSSFILIDYYGLNPTLYSLAFSVNAVGFIGVSQFAGFVGRRVGLRRAMRTAMTANVIIVLALLALTLAGVGQLEVMIVMLFAGYACLGLVVPSSAVLALEEYGEIAGMASALMGTLQFLTAAVMMGIIGFFFNGTSTPMIAGIAACSIIAYGLAVVTVRRREPVPAAE
nr:multidrug effflux MFS transporter [Pelagibacterium xiamenense]